MTVTQDIAEQSLQPFSKHALNKTRKSKQLLAAHMDVSVGCLARSFILSKHFENQLVCKKENWKAVVQIMNIFGRMSNMVC